MVGLTNTVLWTNCQSCSGANITAVFIEPMLNGLQSHASIIFIGHE